MSEPSQPPLLTDGQRRILGFSLGFLALVLTTALFAGSIFVLGRAVGHFANVLWPLAVAGILALILRPVVDLLEARLRGRRTAAVVILYSVFLLLVAGLLLTIIPPLAAQILDFITYLPRLYAEILSYVRAHYPEWIAISERLLSNPTINNAVESLQTQFNKIPGLVLPSLKAISEGVFFVISSATQLAIIPIYLFFFLLSRRDPTRQLSKQLTFLSDNVRGDVVFLISEFIAIVISFFRGQLVIGMIMGVLLALGFGLVGLQFSLVIGLTLGVLNIVPYLGTIIGLVVTLPLAFFQPEGGIQLVGLVLLVYIIVQNIEGWLLTPKIMGDRTGLHPVVIIIAIFFWGTALGGILGMILAIPLTAFFVTAWRLAKRKYFTAA